MESGYCCIDVVGIDDVVYMTLVIYLGFLGVLWYWQEHYCGYNLLQKYNTTWVVFLGDLL